MKRKIGWVVLGALAFCIKLVGQNQPEWIERYYSEGLFQFIRIGIDYGLGWIPFALLYIFVPTVLFFIGRSLWRGIQQIRNRQWDIRNMLLTVSAFLGGTLFFFLFLWGYNYDRLPIEQKLGMEVRPLRVAEIRRELEQETKTIIELRAMIPELGDSSFHKELLPDNLEAHLRENLEKWLHENQYSTLGRVRGRLLQPRGVFLRFSTAGLYFPFTGEGHADAGLHPVQWPHVLTHELGHGYGFGDEGTCNFLAYMGCMQSENPAVAYAGHLGYWRTLAINYLRYQPDEYKVFRENLPPGLINDLNAINEQMSKYPDLIPKLQYNVYDAYLKTVGITDGMLNYNRVIMLVHAWREMRKS